MTDIISVKQLPVIEEHLQTASAELVRIREECASLIATEENLAAIKRRRAEAAKQFQNLEKLRKTVKSSVMEPYNSFEKRYKELISDVATKTDSIMKDKIDTVESALLQEKISEAERYLTEYSAAAEIPFALTLDSLGIHIIRSRSDKSIREEITAVIDRIHEELNAISSMQYASEILYEYKNSRSLPDAVRIVNDRRRIIASTPDITPIPEKEDAKPSLEDLHPPIPVTNDETVYTMTFSVHGTKPQLKALKQYLIDNNLI